MEQRLSIITLGVASLEKSKYFYCALGWIVAEKGNDNIVAYNLPGISLVLYHRDKLAEDVGVKMERGGCSPFALAYNVTSETEVDNTMKKAQASGAKIVKHAQKAFWGGYSGYFADPDGFLWEVAYNPFSKLGPHGEFQWGGYDVTKP